MKKENLGGKEVKSGSSKKKKEKKNKRGELGSVYIRTKKRQRGTERRVRESGREEGKGKKSGDKEGCRIFCCSLLSVVSQYNNDQLLNQKVFYPHLLISKRSFQFNPHSYHPTDTSKTVSFLAHIHTYGTVVKCTSTTPQQRGEENHKHYQQPPKVWG